MEPTTLRRSHGSGTPRSLARVITLITMATAGATVNAAAVPVDGVHIGKVLFHVLPSFQPSKAVMGMALAIPAIRLMGRA